MLTGVESAHEALTPGLDLGLSRSASADTPGAFAANLAKLRDGVAGLDLGRGLFGGGAGPGINNTSNGHDNRSGSGSSAGRTSSGSEDTAPSTALAPAPSSHADSAPTTDKGNGEASGGQDELEKEYIDNEAAAGAETGAVKPEKRERADDVPLLAPASSDVPATSSSLILGGEDGMEMR